MEFDMVTAKQQFEQRLARAAATAMRTDYDLALLESGTFFRRKLAEQHTPHAGECDASCSGHFDN